MILGVHLPRGNVFGLVWVLGDWGICKGVWCVCTGKSRGCAVDLKILGVHFAYWKRCWLGWVGWYGFWGNVGFVGQCGVYRGEGRAVLHIW